MHERTIALAISVALVAPVAMVGCQRQRPNVAEDSGSDAVPAATVASPNAPVYMCPMDRDIRKHEPGKCPRCGMALVTSIPEPVEYRVELSAEPAPRPNVPLDLIFRVFDPWKDNAVQKFSIVHEKLFHAFVVSRDMAFFQHGHPEWRDGSFAYRVTLPRPGMYRVLSDFYPEASTPQLIAKTLFVAGPDQPPPALAKDYATKQAENLAVSFSTNPEVPVAGTPTRLIVTLAPADRLERFLGVWAHMLVASDDLIDLMHTHPLIADGGPGMQFDVVFPRARPYRIWLQTQRAGIVNTVHFDVPVSAPAAAPAVAAHAAAPGPYGDSGVARPTS